MGLVGRNKRSRNWAATKKKTTEVDWTDFAVVRKVDRCVIAVVSSR